MREVARPDPTLHLLGAVRLVTADGDDECPRGRKSRALLGYLAVAPDGSEARERLADLLWTDRGSEQARGSLRQALAEIRRCAPDAASIEAGRERVALDRGRLPTDLDRMRAAAAARRPDELAVAAEGIGGAFLDRLDGLSPGWDDWLRAERPRQHERLVAAVLEAAPDMMEQATDMQAVVRGLERLEPLNEAVARLGLRADHAARDLASLHRRFRRLEEGIAREFDAAPSEETRRLFARLAADAEEPAVPPARPGGAGAGAGPTKPPTVIVAPIAAGGGDEAADLAAMCTEDIRAALARMRHLRVLALDTPDEERLAATCAGSVGVYLLSGDLREVGGEAAVSLRLGSVGDGAVLWSERLREPLADLFAAIERVTERAAGAVTPTIDRELSARLPASAPGSSDAALLFAQARMRLRPPRTLEGAEAAAAALERVLELDPRHLPARILLARLHNTDHFQQIAGHDVAAFRDRADRLLREAAAIEPADATLTVFRAWSHLRRREWRMAELGFERAAAALPYDADTTDACATGLCLLGELDRAEPLFQRAFRLNPFPPPDYHADWAIMLALRGDGVDAEEHWEVSGEPGLPYLAMRLANLAREGRSVNGLLDNFIRGFRAAWRPSRPPGLDDLLAWLDDSVPLRRDEHRAFARDGLAAAVSGAWTG